MASRRPTRRFRQVATMKPTQALTADLDAMSRLVRALTFICGADHPSTLAMQRAVGSGDPRDIKRARALFADLKPGDRQAALAMIAE